MWEIHLSHYTAKHFGPQRSTLILCEDRRRFADHLLTLIPLPPKLFWTTQVMSTCCGSCHKEDITRDQLSVQVFVSVSPSRRGTEAVAGVRAKFDICKLNSAQTWQWWSAVHRNCDCLYLRSCPGVLQQAYTRSTPASSSINDNIAKWNSY